MPTIERDQAHNAFSAGYHSERHAGAQHAVHNLHRDAAAIVGHLPENADAHVEDVWNALLYGIDVRLYEDSDAVLENLVSSGDSIVIWSLGDRQAQVAKVRNAGWEASLRNPQDTDNFRVVAGEDKMPFLPMIASFSQNRRGNDQLFILDDKVANLTDARLTLHECPTDMRIHYVWINRTGTSLHPLPEGIVEVASLTEYEAYVQQQRQNGETVTHALDLDATLIDPKGSEDSRRNAVTKTLTEGHIYTRIGRPSFRRLNGLYIVDHDDVFLKINEGNVVNPDFAGHQAHIYEANGHLVKVFANDVTHRPETLNWKTLGGFRGAKSLAHDMTLYRQKLRESGFPVPNAEFMVARDHEGNFVPIEVVPRLGQSLQEIFLTGSREDRLSTAGRILEVSRPVLLADGIGADIKPANFVDDKNGGLVHIDPLPMIMRDDEGRVITEWPPITAPEIADFLSRTHLSPQAIGFRFYQELCQLDVRNRSAYISLIENTMQEWYEKEYINEETKTRIMDAVVPYESRTLEAILEKRMDTMTGFGYISQNIDEYTQREEHPIYALREMGFLLSERLLSDGVDVDRAVQTGLDVIEERLGVEFREKVSRTVDGVPHDLKFLTIIRKLTHLSQADWRMGNEERAALNVITSVTEMVLDYEHRQSVS